MKLTAILAATLVVGSTAAFAGGHLPAEAKVTPFANAVSAAGVSGTAGDAASGLGSAGGWGNATDLGPAKGKKPE